MSPDTNKMDQMGGARPERHRRPKRLLSGLLTCGACGGKMSIIGTNQWGCSAHKEAGTCSNNRTIMNPSLERRMLGALRDELLQPDLVEEFIAEYKRETERSRGNRDRDRRQIEKKLAEASQRISRLATAMADGAIEYKEVRESMAAAAAERDRLTVEAAELDAAPVVVVQASRRLIVQLSSAWKMRSKTMTGIARPHAMRCGRSLRDWCSHRIPTAAD